MGRTDLWIPQNDKAFSPIVLAFRAYREEVERTRADMRETFSFSILRKTSCDGQPVTMCSRHIPLLPYLPGNVKKTEQFLERMIKTSLWLIGGNGIAMCGRKELTEYLASRYVPGGERDFDVNFFSEVFGVPFFTAVREAEEVKTGEPPEEADVTPDAGSNDCRQGERRDGQKEERREERRVGLDLGGSTLKISALDGERIVYQNAVRWTPKVQQDIGYHYSCIVSEIRKAEEILGKIDFIGVSCAGIVIDNRVVMSSLFRRLPASQKEDARRLFEDISLAFGSAVCKVVNDGEISVRSAHRDAASSSVLALTLGTSLGGGYLDFAGNFTQYIHEPAFVPLDLNPDAITDEWSKDRGVGVSYLSQDAAIRLAAASGIELSGFDTPSEAFRHLTECLERGDETVRSIFEDMGIYLAYALAYYACFFEIRHVLLLGGVAAGRHGEIILTRAREVLKDAFPDLFEQIRFLHIEEADHLQDETAARMNTTDGKGGRQ